MKVGSYGVNSFNFVTNHHYVLQNEINSLHFHQQCMKFPVASHPNQLFVLSVFQILVMLYNGISFELVVFWWHVIRSIILYAYLPLRIFGEMLDKVFGLFFNWVTVLLLLSFKSSLSICILVSSQMSFASIFYSLVCLLILLTLYFIE